MKQGSCALVGSSSSSSSRCVEVAQGTWRGPELSVMCFFMASSCGWEWKHMKKNPVKPGIIQRQSHEKADYVVYCLFVFSGGPKGGHLKGGHL